MKKLAAALMVLLMICLPISAVFADNTSGEDTVSDTTTDTTAESTADTAVLIRYFKGEVTRVEKITQEEDSSLGYNMLRQICEIELQTARSKGVFMK